MQKLDSFIIVEAGTVVDDSIAITIMFVYLILIHLVQKVFEDFKTVFFAEDVKHFFVVSEHLAHVLVI